MVSSRNGLLAVSTGHCKCSVLLAAVCLLLLLANPARAALIIDPFGEPGTMTANELPAALQDSALIRADITSIDASIGFAQPTVPLALDTPYSVTLSATNNGTRTIDSGALELEFPAGLNVNFPPSPQYSAVFNASTGIWTITLTNPIQVGETLAVTMELMLPAGIVLGGTAVNARLYNATAAPLASASASIVLNEQGLYLENVVDGQEEVVADYDQVVRYRLTVENRYASNINGLLVTDQLPVGFRFMAGTVTVDGVAASDPLLPEEFGGRQLQFILPAVYGPQQAVTIEYLAYVTQAASPGVQRSPSLASSLDGSIDSNPNNASVIVRPDPINVDSHVVGRVLLDACEVEPEVLGLVDMSLSSELDQQDVLYTVKLNGDGNPMTDFAAVVELPAALEYVDASAQFNDQPVAVNTGEAGQLLFSLGDFNARWRGVLTFRARPRQDHYGLYETRVHARYQLLDQGAQVTRVLRNTYQQARRDENYRRFTYWPRFATLDARLKSADQDKLDAMVAKLKGEKIGQIYVIGHTDSRSIAANTPSEYRTNLELSEARARVTADYLSNALGVAQDRINVSGKGAQQLLLSDGSFAANQANRRVEVIVEVLNQEGAQSSNIVLGNDELASTNVLGNQDVIGKLQLDSKTAGVAGIRLMMEDGRYVDTDRYGRYHFEALKPGTHVIQIDPDSIPAGMEPYLCASNTRFSRNPASQFVDISKGLIWRSDFHLRTIQQAKPRASLSMNSAYQDGLWQIRVPVNTAGQAATLQLEIAPQATVVNGSVKLNGQAVAAVTEHGKLQLAISASAAPADQLLELSLQLPADVQADYSTRAWLELAGGVVTEPVDNLLSVVTAGNRSERYDFRPSFERGSARLSNASKVTLYDIGFLLQGKAVERIDVVGHSDATPLAGVAKETFGDNYKLSEARARVVADYLQTALQLEPGKVQVSGRGPDEPVADDNTASGRAQNRRVEIFVYTGEQTGAGEIRVSRPNSNKVVQVMDRPADRNATANADPAATAPLAEGILSLTEGQRIANHTTSIRINLDSRLKPELTLDGKAISMDRVGFKQADKTTGKTLYTLFGVDLGAEGQHQLSLRGMGPFGNARFEQTLNYYRTGDVEKIVFSAAEGNIADGKTPVRASIKLLDKKGEPIHSTLDLEIIEGELTPWIDDEEDSLASRSNHATRANIPFLANSTNRLTVSEQGEVVFDPVTKPGYYRVKVKYNEVAEELGIYVKPHYRDWVMVGLAEGSVGYNDLSGNLEAMDAEDIEDSYYDDGRLAFYAKGKIKGRYLLTVAYDSSKAQEQDQRLQQLINPDDYYTLYGDNTEQGFDAASRKKLYLRLDADRFYALFGDFNTDLTVTELSRYSRSFTGARMVYESERASLNAFAAETGQAFKRDEIRGNGTSGLYALSAKNIVANSEKIVIQVRDRLHSERIISERSLNRFVDYSLDYQTGTIYFKEPVAANADNFNPVFIVAEYETFAASQDNVVAGGRAALKFNNEKIEVGATVIHEGVEGAENNLTGADVRVELSATTEVRAEVARSEFDGTTTSTTGDAYLAELTRDGEQLDVKAYIRQQDADFGLNQQNASESGMRKLGVRGEYKVTDAVTLGAEAGQETNLESGATRDTAQVDGRYQDESWELRTAATMADDEDLAGDSHRSDLLKAGASKYFNDRKVKLRADSEWQINNDGGNIDYPNRHVFGADYAILPQLDLFAEHEYTSSDVIDTRSNRAGVRARPWLNATMNSSVEQQSGEYDERTFAVFGLTQAVPLGANWRGSLGYDETRTLSINGYPRVNENAPLASGSDPLQPQLGEDFWAANVGLGYQSSLYLFDSRLEYRDTDYESRYGLFASWRRDLLDGIGHALRLQSFAISPDDSDDELDVQLRYSAVVRPLGSKLFLFNRTDLKYLDVQGSQDGTVTSKFIENLAINYLPDYRWQIALHLGYRLTQIDAGLDTFDTESWLVGSETRFDLAPRWDIGAHYHYLTTPEFNIAARSWGVSTGFDVAENLWLSIGYNLQGYDDEDFDSNGYTAKGPFLKLRFKFDQNTFNLRQN